MSGPPHTVDILRLGSRITRQNAETVQLRRWHGEGIQLVGAWYSRPFSVTGTGRHGGNSHTSESSTRRSYTLELVTVDPCIPDDFPIEVFPISAHVLHVGGSLNGRSEQDRPGTDVTVQEDATGTKMFCGRCD